jgi:phosphomannomutase
MEELFRAREISGVYPQQISEQFAHKVGRAIAAHLAADEIIVGRDCRIGSDKLAAALIKGITDQGVDVINIGLCSMPMFVFAAQQGPGVMVTSSHYGNEYNGFTVCAQGGLPLALPDGLTAIKLLIEQGTFEKPRKKGKARKRDVLTKYVAHVRSFKGKLKGLKVVIDAGNGMAGHVAPRVFGRLPVKVIPLFFELDGRFPNRAPDLLKPGNLAALSKAIKQHKAQLGIAYDGDCDRVAFVDERGVLARPDLALALLAQQLFRVHAHPKVLYDVRCSRAVAEHVTRLGGVPIMTRVGTTFMNEIMKDEGAVLGGELSAHYYFRDNFCADSGDIAAMLLLSLLSEERKPLSKLLAPLQKYFHSGEQSFIAPDKLAVLKKVEEAYADKGKVYHIDGLSIEFQDWWFNLRPSHAEPVLRLVVEARTKTLLNKKVAELKRLLA